MVKDTEEKVMQERVNLWRAKYLHRQLIGDESWMPCGAVETKDDWDLFQPKPKSEEQSRKRKRGADPVQNGVVEHDHSGDKDLSSMKKEIPQVGSAQDQVDTEQQAEGPTTEGPPNPDDVEMLDPEPTTNGLHIKPTSEEDASHKDTGDPVVDREAAPTEADGEPPTTNPSPKPTPPPPRRITRALAAETNPTSNAATPPASPSPTLSTTTSLLSIDPTFLLPPHLQHSTPPLPLPIDELLDTRRLLSMYIQKAEETVRSTEHVLNKLIKAKHMRERVYEWCKAEGHVGEWSDGEDWIDAEYWGEREDDLKKGKDEEDTMQGAGDDGGEGGVGIQGGKKRRNRRRERE